MTTDARVRRTLLNPIVRRKQRAADSKAVIKALERIDVRAIGEDLLSEIRKVVSAERREKKTGRWKDPTIAAVYVKLARALYLSRRISRAEYVYYASSPVGSVHEDRWLNGGYDDALAHLSESMREIERNYGLTENQFWPIGLAPPEHEQINTRYNCVLESKFLAVMREFGLDDLANLRESDCNEFDWLRERGRRTVHHRGETQAALKDLVVRYEEDARRAASAGAYSAAVTLAWGRS